MLTGASGVRSMAAAGAGAIRGGPLRTPSVQSAEQLLCNSSSPISALTSSSSLSAKAITAEENQLVMEAGEPVPRLIFGGVPTFEETKKATAELKQVLDEMYLSSPKSFESETCLVPGISLPLDTEIVDNRSCVIMGNNTSSPGLSHVHQAFRLLCNNSTIQNVVASIASDQTVCEAVFGNSEVKQFMRASQTKLDEVKFYEGSNTFEEDEANATQEGESGEGIKEKVRNLKDFVLKMVTNVPIHLPGLFGSSAIESDSGSDHKENTTMNAGKSGSGFMEKLKNLKNSVVEMASKIPNYLPNLYKSSAAESVSGSDHKGNTDSSPPERSFGTSLTGLAIMVIMLVLFKRV